MPDTLSPLETIYKRLASKNPQIEQHGFDNFAKDMEDEENLKKVFQGLSEKNPQLKEYGFDSFKNDMYGGMREQPVSEQGATPPGISDKVTDEQKEVTEVFNLIESGEPEKIEIARKQLIDHGYTEEAAQTFIDGYKPKTPLQPELEYTQAELDTFKRVDENPIEFNYLSPLRQKQYREYQKQTGKGQKPFFDPSTGYGRGLKVAGKAMAGEIGRAIEDASLKLNQLERKFGPYYNLLGGEKYAKWLDDQDIRIADNIEQIQKWETDVPELQGTFGEKLGALTLFAGMIAATALTRSPSVGKATLGLWLTMGYGQGIGAYDNEKKETGEPIDETTRTGVGLLYAAVYGIPLGRYSSKLMPKGLYNKAVSD